MPVSYSQLQLYRRCPKQYEFAVIKKIPRSISARESFGSSVHNTLKKWGEEEIRCQKPDLKSQLALFEHKKDKADVCLLNSDHLLNLWHSSFIIEGYESRLEADFARRRGERLLTKFYEWWQQQPRTVLAVEKGFTIPLDTLRTSGRFDRVEEEKNGVHVIDYKTSAPRTQEEVDADLQLSIYAMAAEELFGKPCTKLTMLYLNEDALVEMTTVRSSGQLTDARKQIRALYERMEKKDYHPTPSREKCRSCPYHGVCNASAI